MTHPCQSPPCGNTTLPRDDVLRCRTHQPDARLPGEQALSVTDMGLLRSRGVLGRCRDRVVAMLSVEVANQGAPFPSGTR